MINILIILILYTFVFAGSEIAYRIFNMTFLLSRKIAHISGAVVSFFLPFFVSNICAVCIGLFFTIIIFLLKKRHVLKSIHDEKCESIGEVVFPLGIALSALIIWPISIIAYQGSCLVIGLSDGIAGYLGSKYGKRNFCIAKAQKTKEGSLVFFFVTLFIFYFYYLFYVSPASVLGAILIVIYTLIITFIEAIFYGGWDNIIIPITAGFLLLLIVS